MDGRQMDYDNWLTLSQVAKQVGLTRHRVWFLVRCHILTAKQFGPTWLVDPLSLSEFLMDRASKDLQDTL